MYAKFLVCSLVLAASCGVVCAQNDDEPEQLPKLEEMELPTTEQLLNEPPVDWVVLNNEDVLVVESLVPRPGTIEAQQIELDEIKQELRTTPSDQRQPLIDRIEELNHLYVTVPGVQGVQEFRVPTKTVTTIIHHEDLMLRRIYALLDQNKIDPALEILSKLRREWEDWPGVDEAHVQIVFTDARKRFEEGNAANSLMLIDEVYRLDQEHLGLNSLAGQVIDSLVAAALNNDDDLAAQFYLNWLDQRFSNHEVFNKYRSQLESEAQQLISQAEQASQNGEHKQAAIRIEQAAAIWPKTPDLRGPHRSLTERFQRLKVGVIDLPGGSDAYFASSPADLRKRRLTELSLFELDRLRDGTAYYRTRFFDEWEPTDLNRQMKFTLRQFRQPYEMQNILTTAEIVPLILNRLDPEHPDYDERLASYVKSVEIHSPTEFSLAFQRVPPRIEPLLVNVVVALSEEDLQSGLYQDPGGFQVLEQDADHIVYSRKIPEPEGLPKYHVAEVIEQRYESFEKAAQALRRGDVSMIPDLPDWIIRRMQADEEFMNDFFVIPYQLPETQVLQFNPASQAMRSRELRTALAYAVDRRTLLQETVLRDPEMTNGRIITAPFLSSNPGRNILLEPRRFDMSAALAMLLANLKQNEEGVPPLTMIVAPGPTNEDVARQIAERWRLLNLEVNLVYAHEPRPENWDIIYRSVQMVEPIVEIWPFLTIEDSARLADLRRYPDWLKQELVELDRTSDQSRAISAMQTLHRHLWADTSVFPLWELQRYLVIRKNVQGYPKTLMHSYDQLDRWTIDAWYQTELP